MSEITVNKIKILSGTHLQISGQVAGADATQQDQFVTLRQISTTTEGGVTQAYVQAEARNALLTANAHSDSNDTEQTEALTALMISKDATILTAAKVYADSLVVTGGGFPIGGIIMWSGDQTTVPYGWAICDGDNGTPDLRNKFVVGVGTEFGNTLLEPGGNKDAVVVAHTHRLPTDATAGADQPSLMGSANADEGFSQSTESTGESGTNKNLPPYMPLYYIMRTA